MPFNPIVYKLLTYIIAAVWLINGLFCKVLNLVPRHEAIVARILGEENSRLLTCLIGVSEVVMAVWILSGYRKKLNTFLQFIFVIIMNILEVILVPDLLLWGQFNLVFALLFVGVVYWWGKARSN